MGRFSRLLVISVLVALTLPLCAQQSPSSPAPDSASILRVPPPPENATAAELERQGDELRAEKAYLDSIDYYLAAIKKENSAILHNKAGISLLLLRRDREARKEFQAAIKDDKKYPEAYNNLGALFYNERNYGSAVKQYKKAIKLSDDNASFHSNLGTAYFSEKNFDRATQEYQRAMAIDPTIFERSPSGGVAVKLVTSNDLGHFHYVMAQMYGEHNDQQHCRYYLSKANEEGYPIKSALHDNEFAGLRKDPNFIEFVRSLKPPSADSN
ncbi:MAG TPA: tetratricopeptide repeat protein [Candidatus Angelobacter sp.]|nr:tetratricopeptide repeat protein [Candidatus Angelobacter sp.]